MRNILLLCVFAACVVGTNAQSIYYPEPAEWQTQKPAELKMDAAALDSAVRFAIQHEVKMEYDLRIANLKSYAREPDYKIAGPMRHRGKPAGVVLRNGYIAAQWGDLERVDMTFSVTKSYLSTIAGLALDAKLIRSIDERVDRSVWDGTFDGEHNSAITWRHLLTQSSDWSGCLFGLCDWADRPPAEGGIEDWKRRKLNTPGTAYEYNDARVNVLAYSLLQVWRKPLPVVLKEHIMDPIGASPTWRWYGYDNAFVNVDGLMMQSVSGGGHHGGGLFLNTLDQARFGLLFLRKGMWKNRQLLSPQWVESVRQPSPANSSYGLMWWLGNNGLTYAAHGFGGNFIVIAPEQDIVIVTRWLDPGKLDALTELVLKAVKK